VQHWRQTEAPLRTGRSGEATLVTGSEDSSRNRIETKVRIEEARLKLTQRTPGRQSKLRGFKVKLKQNE
jgi:hypothetical protein